MLQKDEFLRLIINSIRNDLISRNEAFQCLALGFVGNGAMMLKKKSVQQAYECLLTSLHVVHAVGGQEMASLLTIDVMNLLVCVTHPVL